MRKYTFSFAIAIFSAFTQLCNPVRYAFAKAKFVISCGLKSSYQRWCKKKLCSSKNALSAKLINVK